MSVEDQLRDLFGDMGLFGGPPRHQDRPAHHRIDKLKAKARTLIDRAYNQALEDVLAHLQGDAQVPIHRLQVEAIRALKRKER